MKSLYLLRHAKATDKLATVDALRPLSTNGIIDANLMFDAIKTKLQKPDLIITSPALRAHHTALIFANCLSIDLNKIHTEAGLYLYHLQYLIDTIVQLPNEINVALLVGHNPHFEQLGTLLIPDLEKLPTSGLLEFKLENGWENLNQKSVLSYKMYLAAAFRNNQFKII
ncbi:MAG: histidine phosphatase family protein [Bacteroidia bacterium]|nr:histidine phosphatase family protein [Bacteroidia bacterium]HQV00784.1 histidine phosphatase family protein [Bacteroidia bacterium]